MAKNNSFQYKLNLLKDLYRPNIDKQALLHACFIKDEQEILNNMTHLQFVTYAYKCSSSVVKLIDDKKVLQKTNECLDLVNQWIGSHYNNKNNNKIKKPRNNALKKAADAAYYAARSAHAAARSAAANAAYYAAYAARSAAYAARSAANAAYYAANAAYYDANAADAVHAAANAAYYAANAAYYDANAADAADAADAAADKARHKQEQLNFKYLIETLKT